MEAMRLDAPFRLSGLNEALEDFEIKYYCKGEKRKVMISKWKSNAGSDSDDENAFEKNL